MCNVANDAQIHVMINFKTIIMFVFAFFFTIIRNDVLNFVVDKHFRWLFVNAIKHVELFLKIKNQSCIICLNVRSCRREFFVCDYCKNQHHDVIRCIVANLSTLTFRHLLNFSIYRTFSFARRKNCSFVFSKSDERSFHFARD